MKGPDSEFIFVTGGARSGKSAFAATLVDGMKGTKYYLATARVLDIEMQDRVAKHRLSRGDDWFTLEEPREIARVIEDRRGDGTILLDCITLWLTNLIEDGLADEEIMKEIGVLIDVCRCAGVVVVSNETGSGIVPENSLARRFRDLSGFANQSIAGAADEAYLVVSGLGVRLK